MPQSRAFVGEVANPITAARIEMAMSGNALAKKLGLSRQYLSRAEQGTYHSLNPSVVTWVARVQGISRADVLKRYALFQTATRNATKETTDPHILRRVDGNYEPGYKLFERWRSGYWTSTVAFSNALCVHPETVRTYEEGIRPQMPQPIRQALLEVDLIDPNWTDEPTKAEATERRLTA